LAFQQQAIKQKNARCVFRLNPGRTCHRAADQVLGNVQLDHGCRLRLQNATDHIPLQDHLKEKKSSATFVSMPVTAVLEEASPVIKKVRGSEASSATVVSSCS
jgi:hypothetical protein